jgi:hypothetical protein
VLLARVLHLEVEVVVARGALARRRLRIALALGRLDAVRLEAVLLSRLGLLAVVLLQAFDPTETLSAAATQVQTRSAARRKNARATGVLGRVQVQLRVTWSTQIRDVIRRIARLLTAKVMSASKSLGAGRALERPFPYKGKSAHSRSTSRHRLTSMSPDMSL